MPRVWTKEQKERMRETQRWNRERDRQRSIAAAPKPTLGVAVSCIVRLDLDELSRLTPAQMSAVMNGIGRVLAASNQASVVGRSRDRESV